MGRGSDLWMKEAEVKPELKVIADPKGTGGELCPYFR